MAGSSRLAARSRWSIEEATLWPVTVVGQPLLAKAVSGEICIVGDSTEVAGWAEGLSAVTTGANGSKPTVSNEAEGGDGLLVARVNGDSDLVSGDDADWLSRV